MARLAPATVAMHLLETTQVDAETLIVSITRTFHRRLGGAASERFGRTRSCVTTPRANASGALTTEAPGGASPSAATSTGSHVGTRRGEVPAAGAGRDSALLSRRFGAVQQVGPLLVLLMTG